MIEPAPTKLDAPSAPAQAAGTAPKESAQAQGAKESGAGRSSFVSSLLEALGLSLEVAVENEGDAPASEEEIDLENAELGEEVDLEASEDLLELTPLPVEATNPTPPGTDPAPAFQPLRLSAVDSAATEASALASEEAELEGQALPRHLGDLPTSATSSARGGVATAVETPLAERVSLAERLERFTDDGGRRFDDDGEGSPPFDQTATGQSSPLGSSFASSLDGQLEGSTGIAAGARAPEPGSGALTPRAPGDRILPELPVRNENAILDQTRLLLNQRGGQARIDLHPPQLGQLGLRIHVTDRSVQLEILTDRLPVAELMTRHLPDLQHALGAQGLQIDRANVEFRERSLDDRSSHPDANDRGDARDTWSRRSSGDGDLDSAFRQAAQRPYYSLGAIDLQA